MWLRIYDRILYDERNDNRMQNGKVSRMCDGERNKKETSSRESKLNENRWKTIRGM